MNEKDSEVHFCKTPCPRWEVRFGHLARAGGRLTESTEQADASELSIYSSTDRGVITVS